MTYTRNSIFIFIIILIFTRNCYCLEKIIIDPALGSSQPKMTTNGGKSTQLYSASYALLISASKYKGREFGGWDPLPETENEFDELAENLSKHGFKVVRIKDPSSGSQIYNEVRSFVSDYGQKVDSRVIIAFSGHGYSDKSLNGYIVPVDAPNPSSDPLLSKELYPLSFFTSTLREIGAKHSALIFDSCFSGAIFTSKGENTPEELGYNFLSSNNKQRGSQIITAGTEKETLPPKSIFTKKLNDILRGNKIVRFSDIANKLTKEVPNNSIFQHPVYSRLNYTEIGDMIFGEEKIDIKTDGETDGETKINYTDGGKILKDEKIEAHYQVFFENDIHAIHETWRGFLQSILKNKKFEIIILQGHCSIDFTKEYPEGGLISTSYGQKIAAQRADAVKELFTSFGINPVIIQTEGRCRSQEELNKSFDIPLDERKKIELSYRRVDIKLIYFR